MKSSMGVVTNVCLTNCPDYLSRVRKILGCLGRSVGMDRRQIEDAALALTEACSNAIRHGCGASGDGRFDVTFTTCSDFVAADVTDSGGRPDWLETEGAKDGLGMLLMRSLADGMEFVPHKNGLTVRLVKRVSSTPDRRIPHAV